MGCIALLFAVISPRLALVWIWLTDDLLSRAFEGENAIPLIGFFLLPWTTLAYAVMWTIGTNEVQGFEWFIVGLAFVTDLGAFAGGSQHRR